MHTVSGTFAEPSDVPRSRPRTGTQPSAPAKAQDHSFTKELNTPNTILEALHQPPTRIIGTVSGATRAAEPNLLGTVYAIGPQLFERSATNDLLNVTVSRAETPPQ